MRKNKRNTRVLDEQIGNLDILKTFPLQFFREVTKREFIEQFVVGLNDDHDRVWLCAMGNAPTKPVEHCYVVIGNRIRYRANIVEFQAGGERTFDDGRTVSARCWMVLSGPIVRAPEHLHRKGFQGFRYTEHLF